MIKVYLDWNIISEMKNGFNDELFNSNEKRKRNKTI